MLTKSPLAVVPVGLAAWMLAASAIAMPAGGMVALCTASGVRLVALPGGPETPMPPDCAKACHLGTPRRKVLEE
ncbi:MAG: hypothetical protein ACRCUI_08315 [Polymorphobacter sp.]